MMSKIMYWSNQDTQKLLKESLLNNMVSIISTDTILGLVAPITEEGFSHLNETKGGRDNKPYLLLISSPQKLEFFIHLEKLTETMRNVINNCWPGPVTIIFQAQAMLPFYLKSPSGTIALRCPQHKELQKLLEEFDALFSTSANKSAESVPTKYQEISPELIKKVNHIVIDNATNPGNNQPSTILDFSEAMNNHAVPIRVVREGAYPLKELEKYYGSPFKK